MSAVFSSRAGERAALKKFFTLSVPQLFMIEITYILNN